jgi:putative ABC transport system substrate-binding protein
MALQAMRLTAVLAIAITFVLFVAPLAGEAQNAERMYRVGYLTGGSGSSRGPFLAALSQGMHEVGYVAGKNFSLEVRSAEGNFERLPSLAQELIGLNPDVLVVSTTPANLAAKAATATIPIVFVGVADPVGVGLVPSLARPGANITGITNIVAELTG